MTFYFIFVITLLQKNISMLTQENALKFLRHRPAISVAAVEKQASIPSGTIAQALSKGRQLSEKHLVALDGVLRDYGYRDDLYQKARVVSVINHKGGVGKTTTVCSLGEALANKGFKVLMVDLDPQGNLSQILGIEQPESQVADALIHDADFPTIELQEGLDLSPSDIDLGNAEYQLILVPGGDLRLKNRMTPLLTKYDYILIDCPPSLGKLTVSALYASDSCLITMQPEMAAMKGVNSLLEKIHEIKKNLNPMLEIDGLVFTMVKKNSVHDGIKEAVRHNLPLRIFNTEIKHLVDFQKAQVAGNTISKFANHSEAAHLYTAFCAEYIDYLQFLK